MKRNTAITLAGAAVFAILIVGGFLFFRTPPQAPQAAIPPLPANSQIFENWALVGCAAAEGDGPCTLMLRVVNQQAQRVVLRLNVLRAQNGNALILITMPPSVVIPAGVTLTPAGGTAVQGGVRACTAQTCTAALLLGDMLVQELSVANMATLEFVTANGQNVSLDLGVQGFDQGYPAWLAASPAPPPAEPGEEGAAAAAAAPAPAAAAPVAPAQ